MIPPYLSGAPEADQPRAQRAGPEIFPQALATANAEVMSSPLATYLGVAACGGEAGNPKPMAAMGSNPFR
jgi:hypothetical protein